MKGLRKLIKEVGPGLAVHANEGNIPKDLHNNMTVKDWRAINKFAVSSNEPTKFQALIELSDKKMKE